MLKQERVMLLLNIVNQKNIVSIKKLADKLRVSDMTIRRDVNELANKGMLIRLRGGVQSVLSRKELQFSHIKQTILNLDQKKQIAKQAIQMIDEGDIIYIGPGKTQELMAHYIKDMSNLIVVTNSLSVFENFKNREANLILVGGSFQECSNSFVGEISNDILKCLKFTKAFVGVSGIQGENMMINDIEEGIFQEKVMNNSSIIIAMADCSKINHNDFYRFYSLNDTDYFIVNKELNNNEIKYYQQYTHVILADSLK